MLIDLTSVAERSEAGVEGRKVTVGWAVAVSIRLLRDEFVTAEAELGVVTGGCCFFFNASWNTEEKHESYVTQELILQIKSNCNKARFEQGM